LASLLFNSLGAAIDGAAGVRSAAGSWASASTTRRGITQFFPRTASACWKATWQPSCFAVRKTVWLEKEAEQHRAVGRYRLVLIAGRTPDELARPTFAFVILE